MNMFIPISALYEMVIYLASPIASTEKIDSWSESKEKLPRNKVIRKKLEDAGFEVYLPQDNQKGTGAETLKEQLNVIERGQFLVTVLSDIRGIYLEAGYAKAWGKKIFALEVEETRKYSDWLVAFFDYIAKDIDELVNHINPYKII